MPNENGISKAITELTGAELFAAMLSGGGLPGAPPNQADLTALKAAAKAASDPNPWKVGDLVQPKENCGKRGFGSPHVVIEVLETPMRNSFAVEPRMTGSAHFGQAHNIRVMCLEEPENATGTKVTAAYWMEHWEVEAYAE